MDGQWTIFDQMIDGWVREVENLKRKIENLRNTNKTLSEERKASENALNTAPWNERAEISADIRDCIREINKNEAEIKACVARIQTLQQDIQDHTKFNNAGNSKVK